MSTTKAKKQSRPKNNTRPALSPGAAPRAIHGAGELPMDKRFWLYGGPVLKDLRELRDALAAGMSEEQFAHHVGPGKNHFAAWVGDVLGEAACAKALRRARSRKSSLRAVETHLSSAADS